MTVIDERLRAVGLSISVQLLVELWTDHCPESLPVPSACPGCGHLYATDAPLCPTAAVVRPLLRKRIYEQIELKHQLTFIQERDLFDAKPSTALPRSRDYFPLVPEPTPRFGTGSSLGEDLRRPLHRCNPATAALRVVPFSSQDRAG